MLTVAELHMLNQHFPPLISLQSGFLRYPLPKSKQSRILYRVLTLPPCDLLRYRQSKTLNYEQESYFHRKNKSDILCRLSGKEFQFQLDSKSNLLSHHLLLKYPSRSYIFLHFLRILSVARKTV